MNWMDDAACTTTDPELFFPEKEGWATAGMAKAICNTCSVAAECLQYAIDNDINEGIFGGLTARNRAALRGAA